MNLCILIPAIVGLISGILGYLLGKMSAKSSDNSLSLQSDLDACRANAKTLNAKIASLESDLVSAKASANANIQNFAKSVESVSAGVATIPYNADLAFSILGKKWKQDDLKIVEGIGPKIEELFQNAGINTWKKMSETPTEELQEVLNGGGERFSIHNPSTWAKQAQLAYEGKWAELKKWQDELDGGK